VASTRRGQLSLRPQGCDDSELQPAEFVYRSSLDSFRCRGTRTPGDSLAFWLPTRASAPGTGQGFDVTGVDPQDSVLAAAW
jgi:hypothetical protein